MPSDTVEQPAAAPLTFFEKLKAAALKIETEALAEVHALQHEALVAEHAAITDVEMLIARIRAKI